MKIAIVFNKPQSTSSQRAWLQRSGVRDHKATALREAAEFGVIGEVKLVRESLASTSHEVLVFGADDAAILCAYLAQTQPDLIFNCCEAFIGKAALEMSIAGLFELLCIPYTGSPAVTLGVLLNKPLTKSILRGQGIKTPDFAVFRRGQELCKPSLGFPLIVKPAAEDASIGIDDHAVVHDEESLWQRIRFVWNNFEQAALVEEFIQGREFSVSLLASSHDELAPLAITEISFDQMPEGRPQILGYEAKWDPSAPFTQSMATQCPATVDGSMASRLGHLAVEVAETVGMRDYGRVDFRLRNCDQALFVLEANPNPDLSSECAFMQAARSSGRTDERTICEILERGLARCGRRADTTLTQYGVA